jgi:VID27 C-terminal WD40-like domain
MLHQQDASLVLQNPTDPESLYRMDLEVGKVVENWKIRDDMSLRAFGPESKFAQMTPEQTLLGVSHNSLFRIDPRLSGNKLVESQNQQYISKNQFSALATTEAGYIAVASEKGDIRLFDRVGIRAKVSLPALGEPITGLDVSADGRWVLATCSTYLLLIDVRIKEGKYEGQLGFVRSFGKDVKPRPRRLQLKCPLPTRDVPQLILSSWN